MFSEPEGWEKQDPEGGAAPVLEIYPNGAAGPSTGGGNVNIQQHTPPMCVSNPPFESWQVLFPLLPLKMEPPPREVSQSRSGFGSVIFEENCVKFCARLTFL